MRTRLQSSLGFVGESQLVGAVVRELAATSSPWSPSSVIEEFDYGSGKTDVLALSALGHVIAFEAKLRDWRRALHQAWRNTSFANQAYVVLPARLSEVAEKHAWAFRELGVGLCVAEATKLSVLLESKTTEPLIVWLHKKAREALEANGRRPSNGTCATSLPGTRVRLC